MKTTTYLPSILTSLCVLTLGLSSPTWGQESTPIAQINGKDVALSADTVIESPAYGPTLKGKLLASGMSFIYIADRSDGVDDSVTLLNGDDFETVCGWSTALTKDIRLVINGDDRYCIE